MDLSKIFLKDACPTKMGGQAVMEGIMMKGEDKTALAVRMSDGSVKVETEMTKKPGKWTKIPIIRGVFAFVDSLVTGTRILMKSAEALEDSTDEDYEESRFEKWLTEKFGSKAVWNMMVYASVIFAIIFSVGIFIILPTGVVNLMKHFTQSVFWLNFTEGVFRILLCVGYIFHERDKARVPVPRRRAQDDTLFREPAEADTGELPAVPDAASEVRHQLPDVRVHNSVRAAFPAGLAGAGVQGSVQTAAAAGDRGDLLRAAQMGGPQRQHRGQGAEPAGALPAEGDYEGAGRQPAGSCDNCSEGSAGRGRAGERDFQQR